LDLLEAGYDLETNAMEMNDQIQGIKAMSRDLMILVGNRKKA